MAEGKKNKISEDKNKVSGLPKEEMKKEKKETIEINFGKGLSRVRENPWIVSTFVLGIILVLALALGGVSGATSSIASEKVVGDNVLMFLNSQVDGEVTLNSIKNEGSYYGLIVDYDGEEIPLQATLDGNYIFTELIPVSGDAGSSAKKDNGNENTVNTGAKVVVEIGSSPIKGDLNAPVTIVEFTDYECPFCQRHFEQTYPMIYENYIKTGKVKYVMMDFPLSFHPNAQKAAEAAHCVRDQAGDEGYFEMHDMLFDNQQSLSVANYKLWAREVSGVNGDRFDECLDEGKFTKKVQDSFAYGSSLGIQGTPGFFINGVPVTGAQPFSAFKQIIDQELAN